jgi:hypothetical protein
MAPFKVLRERTDDLPDTEYYLLDGDTRDNEILELITKVEQYMQNNNW